MVYNELVNTVQMLDIIEKLKAVLFVVQASNDVIKLQIVLSIILLLSSWQAPVLVDLRLCRQKLNKCVSYQHKFHF